MNNNRATVDSEVPFMFTGQVPAVQIGALLKYDTNNVSSVVIAFSDGPPPLKGWVIDRGMLADGCHKAVDNGTVRVRPSKRPRFLVIELRDPKTGSYGVFEVATQIITDFLDRTCKAEKLWLEEEFKELEDLDKFLSKESG